ncbi:Hypothetical predicted protein [Mytilus galloprovincialis]|uniref:Uncharacterized protein n=1 Tax=Mytilus galloprovincialis TaxID=29158 RepID=A0A8B6DKU5_MYTGA|nr:Hypothetical predicted protein [Mytilus galloprovincialis]
MILVDVKPVIGLNHCKFADDGGYNILENDPNWKTTGHPTIWTNIVQYTKVSINMSAQYKPEKFPPLKDKTLTHFVKGIAVGIIQESATISYYKGSALYSSQTTKPCKGLNKDHPKSHEYCNHEFNIVSWSQSLSHNDRVFAEFSSTNGGYVIVADRDAKFDDSKTNKYYYNGKTLSRMFEYHWDLENPYHCSQSLGTSCTPFLDIVDDITENPNLSFTWGGWSDDLAGLDHYEYDLFYLGMDNVVLIDGAGAGGRFLELLSNKNVSVTESSASITLEDPGMYSLHLVAYDKAGNYKSGRTLFLFDNLSTVDTQGNKPTYCSTASKDTSYTWVTKDTSRVKIDWKSRFINIRHNAGKWLNPVQTYAKGEGIVTYEDLYGNRTHVGIKNVGAIVDFQVSYQVDSSDSITTSVKDSRPFTSVSNIDNQYDILTLDWADGDQLTTTVKAIDILDKTNQETIVLYRDATPPIIENIWLTKSDRLNVSVHNFEDFTKMTIEWEAYDVHSGLDSVYWRLYDSKTGVVHGKEDIIAQGYSSNLTHCENKYSDYARGANCYCTPFKGCFHRHFQIKPEIKQHGGLISNKDKGTHEYDYFIEISVTSIAKLTTVLTKKITVDISPPHTGAVHDGQLGNPEIDYQQGMDLHAYWDQFFDRESGVFFYQYIVKTTCADKTDFVVDDLNPNIVETYNTFGTHTVSGDGTYYFTVVAYNRALDPSEPVCSDGVTIDSSVPGVKEVVVKDSLITGGLAKDPDNVDYYILGPDRVRRLIPNPTADCITKSTALNGVNLFPLARNKNGSIVEVDGNIFCSNSSSSPSVIGLTLFKSSLVRL